MSSGSVSREVVTLGSINVDSFISTARLPREGETLSATQVTLLPGGKGANQAACVGILDMCASRFIGQIGKDHESLLRVALETSGVDISLMEQIPDLSTGSAFIFSLPSGENAIVIVGGANLAWFSPSAKALEAVREGSILLLQREVPESVNISAAKAADAAGVLVILDCGGEDAPLSPDLLSRIHVLSPNETELERLTQSLDHQADTLERARSLIGESGAQSILVKRGSRGALFVNGEGIVIDQPAFPLSEGEIVDSTGAGDCFTAAFAAALIKSGRRLDDSSVVHACITFACAAAAVCVQRPGAMPSMPRLQETVKILDTWGKRALCRDILEA